MPVATTAMLKNMALLKHKGKSILKIVLASGRFDPASRNDTHGLDAVFSSEKKACWNFVEQETSPPSKQLLEVLARRAKPLSSNEFLKRRKMSPQKMTLVVLIKRAIIHELTEANEYTLLIAVSSSSGYFSSVSPSSKK